MSLLKKCSKCCEIKPIDDFYKSLKDSLQSQCKTCCNRKRQRINEIPRRTWKDDIDKRLKECGGCCQLKSYANFSKLKTGRLALDNRCKQCRAKIRLSLPKNYQYTWYSRHPGRGREQREKYRYKNCDDWYIYLTKKYGENPECECCGKLLAFGLGRAQKSKVVCFDHRYGNIECIKNGPQSWMMNHACNDKNIQLFESCNFGILCHGCNKLLPTVGRQRWLKRAIQYVSKTETCYLSR